ncbi:MAG TPA: hypothetical protein VFN10_16575 [Thermoanaerobaculia bacterium]|nr:hypothetical protein [Thermoanaerobaculia bacterium]
MTGADSISASDRDLLRRITIALALIFIFVAAFSHLNYIYSHKFFDITGEAKWIWAEHRVSDNVPLGFFAVRDFTLPENRLYTKLKICGDPEYELFVNGRSVAAHRTEGERKLDVYDLAPFVHTGVNRIVVAIRARQGVGGLIASIDIAPEVQNFVVTNREWKIYRRWSPELLLRDVKRDVAEVPMIIGEPPTGRWNYLSPRDREPVPPPTTIFDPKQSFPMKAQIPTIRTKSGVAVAVADSVAATVYDFGFTQGRVRILLERPSIVSRVVQVRFANAREELNQIEWNVLNYVVAPGETEVTDPEPRSFRYVLVVGRNMRAEVVK